ncbi:MAG TPA: GNAT family N-acetyltransferase [Micromonosporaceae bacterium]|nr:GNAT family N-acetyltransferase [Micromonosporaceae bacterium]
MEVAFDERTAASVLAAHRDRLRDIDPLLPEAGPLPSPGEADTLLAVDGAVGLSRRILLDPDDVQATWGALDQRWLSAHATSPVALAGLLGRWREHLAELPGIPGDTTAIVVWPSRDVVMTSAFVTAGLVPDLVIGVRPAGRPTPAAENGAVRVRRASPDDLDDVVALRMEEIRFGAQIGGPPSRPHSVRVMRDRYAATLAADQPPVWLAFRDGRAVGMVSVAVGEQAAWAGAFVAAAPVAYVDCAAVLPAHRGGGVAAALIDQVHRAMDGAGVAVTVLHYAALNPLSAPFWHRSGYRPLRSRWQLAALMTPP